MKQKRTTYIIANNKELEQEIAQGSNWINEYWYILNTWGWSPGAMVKCRLGSIWILMLVGDGYERSEVTFCNPTICYIINYKILLKITTRDAMYLKD